MVLKRGKFMKKGISSILIILITFIICVFLIVTVYFITSLRTFNNVQNNINTNNNDILNENSNNNNNLSNLTIERFLNATKNQGITVPKINSSDSVNFDNLFDTKVLNYYFYTSEDISTGLIETETQEGAKKVFEGWVSDRKITDTDNRIDITDTDIMYKFKTDTTVGTIIKSDKKVISFYAVINEQNKIENILNELP